MARIPVEVIDISRSMEKIIYQTIQFANSLQEEFWFSTLSPDEESHFYPFSFRNTKASDFLDIMSKIRKELRGYHPYIIAVVDSFIEGKFYSNLFGSHNAKTGLGFFTTHNVFDYIIPANRSHCYILYYLARYSLSFVAPDRKNHNDTKDCAFDRKIFKKDILRSMKSRPFCDECRKLLINQENTITAKQVSALDVLFGATKTLLEQGYTFSDAHLDSLSVVKQEQEGLRAVEIITDKQVGIMHAKQRRLNVLQLQKAQFGYHTPPQIIMEIEDIERELAKIRDNT